MYILTQYSWYSGKYSTYSMFQKKFKKAEVVYTVFDTEDYNFTYLTEVEFKNLMDLGVQIQGVSKAANNEYLCVAQEQRVFGNQILNFYKGVPFSEFKLHAINKNICEVIIGKTGEKLVPCTIESFNYGMTLHPYYAGVHINLMHEDLERMGF